MHLEDLFWNIEQNRREFIAKRAEEIGFTDSDAAVLPRGAKEGQKSADDDVETVLTEAGAGALPDARD